MPIAIKGCSTWKSSINDRQFLSVVKLLIQHNFNIFTLHQHHRTFNDHLREHSARNRKLARNRKSHLKNILWVRHVSLTGLICHFLSLQRFHIWIKSVMQFRDDRTNIRPWTWFHDEFNNRPASKWSTKKLIVNDRENGIFEPVDFNLKNSISIYNFFLYFHFRIFRPCSLCRHQQTTSPSWWH